MTMPVPPKPKRMSEKRYRELYDSDPCVVEAPGVRITTCGAVSAEVVAATYRAQGLEVTIRPAERADAPPP
jgi:hypothetical protein